MSATRRLPADYAKYGDLVELHAEKHLEEGHDCYETRMSFKSEYTEIVLNEGLALTSDGIADSESFHVRVHDTIKVMYQLVVENIYSDIKLKKIIIKYLIDTRIIEQSERNQIFVNQDLLGKFVKLTCNHAKLPDNVAKSRYDYILIKFQELTKTHILMSLFEDLAVFNLFFRIYLKGGMATRWICSYLNTISAREQKKTEKSQ